MNDKEARDAAREKALANANVTGIHIDHRYAFDDGFESGWDAALEHAAVPLDALLWCPNCFEQHIDEAKPDVCETCGAVALTGVCPCFTPWLNPPHKSHRCNFCNHVWRPADGPTNGVQSLKTKGENDQSAKPCAFASRKDRDKEQL